MESLLGRPAVIRSREVDLSFVRKSRMSLRSVQSIQWVPGVFTSVARRSYRTFDYLSVLSARRPSNYQPFDLQRITCK